MFITLLLKETEEGPQVYANFDVDVELMKAFKGNNASYLAAESKPHFEAMLSLLKEMKNDTP